MQRIRFSSVSANAFAFFVHDSHISVNCYNSSIVSGVKRWIHTSSSCVWYKNSFCILCTVIILSLSQDWRGGSTPHPVVYGIKTEAMTLYVNETALSLFVQDSHISVNCYNYSLFSGVMRCTSISSSRVGYKNRCYYDLVCKRNCFCILCSRFYIKK